jgi:hypothetical protein
MSLLYELSCGLHPLLNHRGQVREIQDNIGRMARLFSFGMEHTSMKHIDATAPILVRIHHYGILGQLVASSLSKTANLYKDMNY